MGSRVCTSTSASWSSIFLRGASVTAILAYAEAPSRLISLPSSKQNSLRAAICTMSFTETLVALSSGIITGFIVCVGTAALPCTPVMTTATASALNLRAASVRTESAVAIRYVVG